MEGKRVSDKMPIESEFEFDYLVIIDFECQCLMDGKLEVQEIVEFPAVVVDVKKQTILDEVFHYYIRPTVIPVITDFCTELTGITQDKVDEGILIDEALIKFDEWLEGLGLTKGGKRVKNFLIVTDGNSDIGKFLDREVVYKKIQLHRYMCEWLDLRESFHFFTGIKTGIRKQLRYFNIEFEGSKHSGIDDSRNIARIVQECLLAGFKFPIQKMRTTYEIKGRKKVFEAYCASFKD